MASNTKMSDNLNPTQNISSQPNNGSGNNNYVDFNQFIMQHKFYNGTNGLTSNATTVSSAVDTAAPSMSTSTDNRNYYQQHQQTQQGVQGTSFYNTNSNAMNGSYCEGAAYSPFGYNPFATGFNFPTQLQANAPEFVPRFSKLNLNEENNTAEQTPAGFKNGNQKKATNTEKPIEPTTAESNVAVNAFQLNGAQNDEAKHVTLPSNTSSSSSSPSMSAAANAAKSNSGGGRAFGSGGSKKFGRNGLINGHGTSPSAQKAARAAITDNRRFPNGQHREFEREERHFERNDMSERKDGSIRFERHGKNERNERTERGDRNERSERSERSDRNDRTDRSERSERPDRFDRYERSERGGYHRNGYNRDREKERDYNRDHHRSNKRRDDWNRNRDRINGFRVEERFGSDNGKESPLPSPEKKLTPRKSNSNAGSPRDNEKLSQREKLTRDIQNRRLECLVCVEPIKSHQTVWSCHNCYHILHLQCTTKWATSSAKPEEGWRCPACQNVVKEIPRDYYCFCGKMRNPPYNRQDVAHSCGEVCGRIESCSHGCTLLCHPGPCPPCQAMVRRECGCTRTFRIMQCYLTEPILCEAVCGKLLNCELHTCTSKCHEGKCAPCTEKVEQTCHCAKDQRQVACTRDSHEKRNYSCGKPCSKELSCKNHKCKDCCHAGECRPCKQSPEVVTSCPCGKMPIIAGSRKSCLDPIPLCEGICNKTLRCGKATNPHHCTNKCHLGNCPPCNKQTAVKCRCGNMDQMIKCRQLSTRADDARCKKRCTKKRSCGKHKCNQECCIDIDHICPMQCSSKLSCGKHKCDQPCHRGNCPPCYRSSFEELYCECGAEVIYPPVPCGTKRPPCKRPCSRSHPCEHPPQHNCHSAPICPPCMMFTTKWCFGNHEQRKTIPCSQESFSCGLACGKALPCGRHKCIKSCHEGPCQTVGEICKQNCTKLRSSCGHKCQTACHEGSCPETPCKEMVEVQCECGNRKQQRPCHELVREFSRIATAQLASSMAEMQRGNYMELSEILAPVKVNKSNKTLDCNDECRLVERNRRLAIGLQIRNPDLTQKLQTKYSDFVRSFAKRDPTLVKSVYDALTNLVKLAKESKQKSRSHSFPVMNREKRQLVHELCEMFGVEAVAYDAEPNRNVVATAYKNRSWMPATSIIEVLQREAGQRRVPVPNNNAWGTKR